MNCGAVLALLYYSLLLHHGENRALYFQHLSALFGRRRYNSRIGRYEFFPYYGTHRKVHRHSGMNDLFYLSLWPTYDVSSNCFTFPMVLQIDPAGKLAYAICLRCKANLQRSVEYRDACLNNDILFRQLFFSKSNYSNDHTDETKCSAETIAWDSDAIEFINPATETTPLAVEDGDRSSFEQSIPEFEPEQDECSNPESVAVCELENTNEPKESPQKPGHKRAKQKQLCVLCGKTVTYLARHLNSHTKNSTYSCPHCSQTLTDHSNLMRHIRAVHQKKVIMFCTPCDRGFTSKNSYDAHMVGRGRRVVAL